MRSFFNRLIRERPDCIHPVVRLAFKLVDRHQRYPVYQNEKGDLHKGGAPFSSMG